MTNPIAGAVLASTPYKARLLVTISEGLVDVVAIQALDPSFDVSAIELVKIDFDTEGACDDDGVLEFDGAEGFVSVGEVDVMSDEDARLARAARDTWALSD